MSSPSSLFRKKILLGVCGSIAAYKAVLLTRLLVKEGAEVKVIMTDSATDFVAPLTFSTLSKNRVYTRFFDGDTAIWNSHIELGLWADIFIIAPASANTLAKIANGHCENLLAATYLSARCPVVFAPAMDLDMWQHKATRHNVQRLLEYGNQLVPVGEGELASGLYGEGRMAEPEAIITFVKQLLAQKDGGISEKITTTATSNANTQLLLLGQKVLINAGPTYEPIDPVRFIGNRSSGKMGIALADLAAQYGAEVHLVLGPTHLRPQNNSIKVYAVETAQEMFGQTTALFPNCDIALLAAAVADYTPMAPSEVKIKKKEANLTLELQKTQDILATLGQNKHPNQILVGFALETNNGITFAIDKLKRKNLDLIVLNTLEDAGAGFKHDTNKVSLIDQSSQVEAYNLKDKTAVAADIWHKVIRILTDKKN